MSFFDDEGDEPTRVTRSAPPRRPGGPAVAGTPDPQTARVRQLVALGMLVLVVILLALGIDSCRDSARERSLKDYNREVATIARDSSQDQVSRQLFEVLSGGGTPNDLQLQVNQIRLVAREDVRKAEGLDVPDEMKAAQRNLLLVLNLRSDGVGKIADELPNVQANAAAAEQAVSLIAGQMQAFLASDVIYRLRVQPLVNEALLDNDIAGQNIPDSRFLPNLGWLDPAQVAERLGSRGGGGQSRSGAVAPGTHGHGLTSVSVGQLTLQPGEAVNRIPAGAGLAFNIRFANQGENDETDVTVSLRISGSGRPITRRKRLNQTRAGSEAQVSIPLDTAPPIGQPVTIRVTVEPVRGERTRDNNTQEYTALFTR